MLAAEPHFMLAAEPQGPPVQGPPVQGPQLQGSDDVRARLKAAGANDLTVSQVFTMRASIKRCAHFV